MSVNPWLPGTSAVTSIASPPSSGSLPAVSGRGSVSKFAIIATNAKLNKTQLTKVAQLVHDGLARAIRPVHTMLDGDTVYVVSVGWDERVEMQVRYPWEAVDRIGSAGADTLVRAILKAMEAAESIPGWISYRDWKALRDANRK